MAGKKTKPKDVALELYLAGDLDQGEIAELVGVSERTLTTWVNADGAKWKKMKALRQTTPQESEADLVEIIADIIKRRKDSDDPRERLALADEVAKWSKVWENLKKDSRLSLKAHTTVMRDFLVFCQQREPKILHKIIELQRSYIMHKAPEYT